MMSFTNMTREENEDQLQRMRHDLTVYGRHQTGSYRGVSYLARKNLLDSWCAYVQPGREVTDDEYERLEGVAHGGITGYCDGPGFDCCHLHDYPGCADGEYRDFPYVLQILQSMIDVLLD